MKNLMLQLSRLLTASILVMSTATMAWADDDILSQAELDQMLAPVALYPDTVLTHVLIAATYPLEVVQASRWAKANSNLTGDDAVKAVESKSWDPSVKALVAFPQLLERLSSDLDWTEQLGEAFLADETQVLASIQTLRQKAYANGSLNDHKHVVVEREREVIIIEPARKEVIYVPVYDTRVVYGDWWWPSYPPVYWQTAGVQFGRSPFYWGVSVNVRPWFYFGIFDWRQHHVVVNHHYYHTPPRYYPRRHTHFVNAHRWTHNTEHRRGVQYRHARLNRDYNSGYGYSQPTRETKGIPARRTRVDSNVTVRENKQQYQRRTAEQVRLPNRELRANDNTPRQRNEALRQQLNTPQRERQAITEQRRAPINSTEQLRQREQARPLPRIEPNQVKPEQRQQSQHVQVQQRQAQPAQNVQVQQRQPRAERQPQVSAPREQRAATTTRNNMAQNQERRARQID